MSYLGQVELKSSEIRRIDVTGSTSATHTLTWTPASEQSLIITINGIKQQNNYSISGVTLTLDDALLSADKMEVIGILDIGEAVVPPDDSITNAMVNSSAGIVQSKLATLAITDSEVADNALSGNKIDGGTISNFASTGIDDNADATAITIDSSEQVGIQLATTPAAPLHVKVTGGSGTATEVARFETTGHSDASAVVTDYRTAHTRGEINLLDGTGSYDSNIVFKTATGSLLAAPTEKIRIGPTGELGIGGATFGTAGQALLSGGAGATVTWGSAGGGKVLQLTSASSTSDESTTSSSAVATSHTISITPTAASNKIVVTLGGGSLGSDNGAKTGFAYIHRSAPSTATFGSINNRVYAASSNITSPCALTIVDVSASTAVHTYELMISADSGGTCRFNQHNDTSYMVAWELDES